MPDKTLKIVLFSGGRGTRNISRELLLRSDVFLTLAVNAYDDGLSTGRLRDFIPGMLGPSDVRKNITALMDVSESPYRALHQLLEYRFPDDISRDDALACLKALTAYNSRVPMPELKEIIKGLNVDLLEEISSSVEKFLAYFEEKLSQGIVFSFRDCSIGNILFAGHYLRNGSDFNFTASALSRLCRCKAEILNVANGENLVLAALKKDNTYLERESEIVDKHKTNAPIEELFLLPEYLSPEELSHFNTLSYDCKKTYLERKEIFPEINPDLKKRVLEANVIVYGPGTQHSSLFPSYMTKDLTETIVSNTKAVKVFISNISRDNDIQQENVETLFGKFLFYHSRKGKLHITSKQDDNIHLQQLVTHAFIQQTRDEDANKLHFLRYPREDSLNFVELKTRDWEEDAGRHHGSLVERELLALLEQKKIGLISNRAQNMLSIIIPALDEEKTIEKVLLKLRHVNWHSAGLVTEIIVADGGSSDSTADIVSQAEDIRLIRMKEGSGLGAAILAGLEVCRGNVILLFPADDEYSHEDLIRVVRPILTEDAKVVFGSRNMKCVNMNNVLRKIYGNKKILYLLSKYGGLSISSAILWKYGQMVSDPLTSVKAFQYDFFRSLALSERGHAIVGEMIAKTAMRGEYILEVPVGYSPRSAKQGKKMNVSAGLKVLSGVIRGWNR
ncbi:MAG: 2-phospho-L-lactate transferase CofD family protein [Synergistaceae bacterium]|jgi:2-phospho-L-lactate transferase/gluconeogenesis factor (CofD/UPF0052 family)|nr:2-phospho-L-lactate transferase CofD family protein [Synergistaceae bacterium]